MHCPKCGYDSQEAGRGRPKAEDRCPCGIMTAERAEKRNHVCVKPKKRRKRPGKASKVARKGARQVFRDGSGGIVCIIEE